MSMKFWNVLLMYCTEVIEGTVNKLLHQNFMNTYTVQHAG